VPDNQAFGNGFRTQWERFLTDLAAERQHPYDFRAGVRGLQLVDAGLRSSREGRRIELDRTEPAARDEGRTG
jgi:predicted dehydrogenase